MCRLITIGFVVLGMGIGAGAQAPAKVLVLPFEGVGTDKAWVGKAVQQNMLAELARVSTVAAVPGKDPIGEIGPAVQAGKDAGAQYVVLGSYQSVDADLRIVGQVVDVGTQQAVAGLKATGSQRDLFGLEDTIVAQVKRALPQPAQAAAAPAGAAPAGAAQGAGGMEMLKQPAAAPDVPRVPVEWNAQARARQLEEAIDRAVERLQNQPYYDDYAYYPQYRYPLYYPWGSYGYGWGYGYQTNVAIVGSFNDGKHGHWGFRSGACPDGRNYSVPHGNYAVFPSNYARSLSGNYARPIAGNYARPISGNYARPIAGNSVRPMAGNVVRPMAGNVVRPTGGTSARPIMTMRR